MTVTFCGTRNDCLQRIINVSGVSNLSNCLEIFCKQSHPYEVDDFITNKSFTALGDSRSNLHKNDEKPISENI
jgi:hypothetical protein